MICPICGVNRPEEVHLDWCTYEGPEPEEEPEFQYNEETENYEVIGYKLKEPNGND